MIRIAPLALATLLAATAPAYLSAQTKPFTDPANLRGERVSPLTGRELPIDQGALGLEELLRKLSTRASILNIVAHPDDEDGGMLTLYARGLGARVADLSLTRGEGGQNAATSDFEDALGLLRTQELLANDRYTGVTQFFGTEVDFGFSKTKAESFSKWGHQRVLYDVVRAIRLYRPLIITSTWIGNPTDGHGQHQVAGEIAQEAFLAAGNPNVFPELTKEGILPWQPLKIYARVPRQAVTARGLFDYATGQYTPARFTNYVTGKTSTTPPSTDIVIHEGTFDPLITTCAANPADLPPQLRAASVSSPLSSRPALTPTPLSSRPESAPSADAAERPLYFVRTATTLSSRPEAPERAVGESNGAAAERPLHFIRTAATLSSRPRSAHSADAAERPAVPPATSHTDCKPLTYVQFARIGLGLQKSQIGPGVRLASAGRFDVPYHLYGSRLCDAPSDAVILSAARSAQSKDPCIPRVPPQPGATPQEAATQAPTARNIPAQGNALGSEPPNEQRAESPTHNPALDTQPNFFDGIDTSLNGILSLDKNAPLSDAAWEHITQSIAEAQTRFDPQHPETIAPLLADALANVNLEIDLLGKNEHTSIARESILHELRIKRVQLNDALALALGLSMQATAANADIPAYSVASATDRLSEGSSQPIDYVRGWALSSLNGGLGDGQSSDGKSGRSVSRSHPLKRECGLTADQTPITRPYFTRKNIEQPVYDLLVPALRNAPATPPALTCWAELTYNGAPIRIGTVVQHRNQPVSFVPPASVSLLSHAQVMPLDHRTMLVSLVVRPVGTRIEADLPAGWKVTPDIEPRHSPPGFKQLRLEPSADTQNPVTITAIAVLPDGQEVREGYRPVGYGSLPRVNFYTPATDRIVPVDLKLPPANKRRIGYLPGTGDAVPEALASIGLKPTILTVADLTPEKLSNFDTVILGVRTYNAHPDLHGAPTHALLDFARAGGNVLVQYQTREFTAADAPFPLSLGSDEKVVDETDPVEILHPSSTLLTTPNHIGTTDFDHWIEERGHGFLASWDPHYTALTETHDPGQAPQKGGLITVRLGKGRWTYCAFALYRQLPEAVPGAYRLFVNLLNP